MANISGIQTVDNINLLSVDADPSLAGGTPSPIGSIATVSDGSGLYLKTGVSDTDYTKVAVNNSAVSFSQITLSGNLTSTAWTTNGIRIKEIAGTFTDTTSSGTVAAAYSDVIGGDTIAASNSTVFTDYYGMYIKTPIAGMNVTFTNSWALGLQGGANIGGRVSIGNYATPSAQRLVTIGQDTAWLSFGSLTTDTSFFAMYACAATPSGTNYIISSNGNGLTLNAPTSGNAIALRSNNTNMVVFSPNNHIFTYQQAVSGAITSFTLNLANNTNQTTSTEIPNFKINGNSKTWAAGAITTQRWNYLTANTSAFASASVITYSYGLYVEKAIVGTNATITTNIGIGTDGDLLSAGSYHWQGTSTPTTTNFTSYKDAATAVFNGGDNVSLANNGTTYFDIRRGGYTSGTRSGLTVSLGSNTNQTASTEISGYLYNSYSRQWDTGNITTQRERYYKTVTYTAVGASVITNAYGAYFEAPTASTNVTITNNYAIGTTGNIFCGGNLSMTDSGAITTGGTNGTRIATSTAQKIGFWGATPIVRPANTVAIDTLLVNTGLRASGAYANFDTTIVTRAGTATANTSPVKFTSGTLMTVAESGAMEYDGNFWGTEASTLRKAFVGNIYTQTTSVTVANTVTETSLLTSTVTLPANFFTIGKQLNIKVRGFHSGASTPTIRIRVKLGSTVVLDTGVINSGNSTNAYFDIDGVICCRTTGATGTIMSQGYFTELGGGAGAFGMTNTAASTIDTTASLVYDVTVEWGTASASNTITSTNGYVCVMK